MDQLEADIETVAGSIWDAMFDESISLTRGGTLGGPPFVTSFVAISGAWNGAVVAQFPTELGAQLTRALLGASHDPTPEEIIDALGEIGNIVAGNVKALVPEPSQLSLPVVAFGSDYSVNVVGSRTLASVPFTCMGQVFSLSVLESITDVGLELQ